LLDDEVSSVLEPLAAAALKSEAQDRNTIQ
jgi:hypothetical protein